MAASRIAQKGELQNFLGVNYGPLAWFWKGFGVSPNEPFHTQRYGIWHIGSKRLCESPLKKLAVSIAEVVLVKALAWRESGCNKLTKWAAN